MDDQHETVEYSRLDSESNIQSHVAPLGSTELWDQRRLGLFELVRPIGSGGMSLVFEAVDTRSGQRVALKMLHNHGPSAIQRLKREFRALADMHHANLVQLHELFVGDDKPFFTMELIHGISIGEYLSEDIDRLEYTLRQLVDAVSHLHAGGLLHRDLKPSNILVQSDGRVVVLDFGLARAVAEQPEGLGSGTPAYMAPERLRGDVSTEPSDWFAVGVILHEVLTGHLPSSRSRARTRSLSRASDVERFDAEALTLRLLAAEPGLRPTGHELRQLFGCHRSAYVIRARFGRPDRLSSADLIRSGSANLIRLL